MGKALAKGNVKMNGEFKHMNGHANSIHADGAVQMVKWSKKLYIKTGYPDNYVDKTFLELKKTNVNAEIYTYWTAVYYSGVIIHQLSSVVIFALIYVCLRLDYLDVKSLMFFYVAPISLLFYSAKLFTNEIISLKKIKYDFMNLFKFISFTYGLSPILNSLTESISSDTIYATSTLMLFLNLVFHDYYSLDVAIVSKTFSFNVALFAGVCLASRFNTSSFHAFSLITISFILFALWPEYRRNLQTKYSYSILIITILSVLFCLSLFIKLKLWSFGIMYLALFFIISFVCPAVLVNLQVYKNTIHGPWDEAIIKN